MTDKQTPFGNPFWMTGGIAPAIAATQFMMDASIRMYWATLPARMLMGAAPFAVTGWMLSQVKPRAVLLPPEAASAPAPKRTDGATDAEIVTTPPARSKPRMTLVVSEPEVVAAPVVEEVLPEFPEWSKPAGSVVEPVAEVAVLESQPQLDFALTADAPVVPERPTALSAAPVDGGDDLKRIKGIGVKLAAQLNGLGYYRFEQIAAWGEAELAWVDLNLVGFAGRATRDDWIGQAKKLIAGSDTDGMH